MKYAQIHFTKENTKYLKNIMTYRRLGLRKYIKVFDESLVQSYRKIYRCV